MKTVLAIDPGVNGGIVLVGRDGALLELSRIPKHDGRIDWRTVINLFASTRGRAPDSVAAIEVQRAFTGEGKNGKVGIMSSTGIMLENYGRLKLCLELAGYAEYAELEPRDWQRFYFPPRKRVKGGHSLQGQIDRNRENNARTMATANALYPGAAEKFGRYWTPGTATAALIGNFYRRIVDESA